MGHKVGIRTWETCIELSWLSLGVIRVILLVH